MDEGFKNRINKLPEYMERLKICQEATRTKLGNVPVRGVYLFFEHGIPFYVGRTNRMRQRLLEHGRLSAGHNDASFAYLLAKEKGFEQGMEMKRSRLELILDEDFDRLFLTERMRVASMTIKYVEISDPVDQCLFEVYAAEVFNTRYNDFDNH